jgi:pathogenesis-related protein 1
MVWKNTTEVGCAAIECNGMTLWVCNYNPPGNYRGQKPY